MLPPYDTAETLRRLEAEIDRLAPRRVVSLGDSFDDLEASQALDEDDQIRLNRLCARRDWFWVEGNHDPGDAGYAGLSVPELRISGLAFRHIATGSGPEVTGHYHPKASIQTRGRRITRRCFVHDRERLIMPAFGTYTGGLNAKAETIAALFGEDAQIVMLADPPARMPLAICC